MPIVQSSSCRASSEAPSTPTALFAALRLHARRLVIAVLALASAVLPARASAQCIGDCNGNNEVTVDELLRGVNIGLGTQPLGACTAFDADGDTQVSVSELIQAVNAALNGCGPLPTPTPMASVETRCTVPPGDAPVFDPEQPDCELLSSYRFFVDGARQIPNAGVIPYALNTELFSDYAVKRRFIYVPPGRMGSYHNKESFRLPVGSVVIKTFAFPYDFRDPSAGERLIETRLLLHRKDGWSGISYLWNAEMTEARRRPIGAAVPVTWVQRDGASRSITFRVPNVNQCKECHREHNDVMGLVGVKARNLNRDFSYPEGSQNQLTKLASIIAGIPDPALAPRAAVFDDPTTGTLEQRARAYLDVNCGNCHNASGAARTSGLFLDIASTDPTQLGICKSPVAAGRGSCGLRYAVVPGRPDESILICRMESIEADIAMPELGRQTVHDEGVAVLREWISSLQGSCTQ